MNNPNGYVSRRLLDELDRQQKEQKAVKDAGNQGNAESARLVAQRKQVDAETKRQVQGSSKTAASATKGTRKELSTERKTTGSGRSFDLPQERTNAEKTEPTVTARVGQGVLSALAGTSANLANTAGSVMDVRGGTSMRGMYESQVSTLDSQISVLERIAKNPSVPRDERNEAVEALAIAQSQRDLYAQAVRANEGTARELYHTADAGRRYSRELAEKSIEGTTGLEQHLLSAVPEVTNIVLDAGLNTLAPGLGTTTRALENAGGEMMDYRERSGTAYDPRNAAVQGLRSVGGVAAGGLLSGTVNDLGAEILYSWGLQRRALPKAIKSGANAVAYAIGETGGGELGRMATEENYTPDWQAIGKRGASAFAFGFASELLKSAALSARDKAYLRENLSDAQKSYEAAMDSLTDPLATSEQQQKLAQRALDHVDWARNQLDEINVSDRAAEQARAALTDAIEELRPLAAGNSPFGLDSSGIPSNNTLDLGQKGSFGERMVGQISGNPLVFGEYDSPASLKAALEGAGFEVKPLGKGAFSNTPFESGGGYRINFSDGGLLQYHPEAHSHHGGAYYKISTGKGGTHHYDIRGNEKVII